jgi:hypothetical protein
MTMMINHQVLLLLLNLNLSCCYKAQSVDENWLLFLEDQRVALLVEVHVVQTFLDFKEVKNEKLFYNPN